MARLALRFLGTYSVDLDGTPVTGFTTEKERALLAYLAMQPGKPLRRSHLAGLLWPDQSDERALHSCRQALSTLRRLLADKEAERPLLVLARDSVSFNQHGDYWVDVLAFRGSMSRALVHYSGRDGPGRLNVRALQEAVAVYGGPLLDDLSPAACQPLDEWLLVERENLARDAVAGLALLARYHEARGEYGRAFAVAARLTEVAPHDEESHRLAMRLAAADGQWAAARGQYQTCCRCLAALVDTEPSHDTRALLEQIERRSLPAPAPPPPAVLPPPTDSVVGREKELGELAARLSDPLCRLVTVTGAGGSGKTRLALEGARQQVGLFGDGVYFVPMANLASDAPLEPAVASALGFVFSDHGSLAEQLADYLHGRSLLLVLDNLEHLHQAPAFVTRLLDRAPKLVILATSRTRLALREEWLLPLDGLPCPLADARPDAIHGWDAPRLLLARVQQVHPHFVLNEAEAMAVGRICRQVDGLPLGIELAAGLLPGRTCADIAADIAAGLDALASGFINIPERHRSLRAVFRSSYERLHEDEQHALAALSIFVGGFDATSAEAVTGVPRRCLEPLTSQSLIRADACGRFTMHEMTRQFAREQLASDPAAEAAVQRRHARHFTHWLSEQALLLTGATEAAAIEAIGREMGNVLAAWAWAAHLGDVEALDKALAAIYRFHYDRSLLDEGMRLFEAALPVAVEASRHDLHGRLLAYQGALGVRLGALDMARDRLGRAWGILSAHGTDADRALCLLNRAELLMHMGDHDLAAEAARAALALIGANGDPWARSSGLRLLGDIHHRTGDLHEARRLLGEALLVARASGRAQAVATALNSLGDVVCHLGDYDRGLTLMTESVRLLRARQDRWRLALAVNNLGTLYHETGALAEARDCYQESADVCHDLGDVAGEAVALSNLGELALARGETAEAEGLFLTAMRLAREADVPWALMCTLDNLGIISAERGDTAAAAVYFGEALAEARASAAKPMLLRLLVHMAAVLLQGGGSDSAAAALRLAVHHEAVERHVQRQAESLLHQAGIPVSSPPDLSIEQAIEAVCPLIAQMERISRAG